MREKGRGYRLRRMRGGKAVDRMPGLLLYSDRAIAVAVKPVGVQSERGPGGMPGLIASALGCAESGVYPVHRLDAVTGGVMVYALSAGAAAALSRAVQAGEMRKTYLAVTEGLPPAEGRWEDLLFFDTRSRKAYVVDRPRRGAKQAILTFERLKTAGDRALVRVQPLTGRTHQIRVQFASRGFPLAGDRRYGAKTGKTAALWSHTLSFPHPETGERLTFSADAADLERLLEA